MYLILLWKSVNFQDILVWACDVTPCCTRIIYLIGFCWHSVHKTRVTTSTTTSGLQIPLILKFSGWGNITLYCWLLTPTQCQVQLPRKSSFFCNKTETGLNLLVSEIFAIILHCAGALRRQSDSQLLWLDRIFWLCCSGHCSWWWTGTALDMVSSLQSVVRPIFFTSFHSPERH